MPFFKKTRKWIICSLITLAIVFIAVVPVLRQQTWNLIKRIYNSHSEFVDEIQINAYILSDEQVGELFLHPDRKPVLLTNAKFTYSLYGVPLPHRNLVFQITTKLSWVEGIIQYDINEALIGQFNVQGLKNTDPLDGGCKIFVIPLGGVLINQIKDDMAHPEIIYKWRRLYAKR